MYELYGHGRRERGEERKNKEDKTVIFRSINRNRTALLGIFLCLIGLWIMSISTEFWKFVWGDVGFLVHISTILTFYLPFGILVYFDERFPLSESDFESGEDYLECLYHREFRSGDDEGGCGCE